MKNFYFSLQFFSGREFFFKFSPPVFFLGGGDEIKHFLFSLLFLGGEKIAGLIHPREQYTAGARCPGESGYAKFHVLPPGDLDLAVCMTFRSTAHACRDNFLVQIEKRFETLGKQDLNGFRCVTSQTP